MGVSHPQDSFSLQAINGVSITYQQKLELVVCAVENVSLCYYHRLGRESPCGLLAAPSEGTSSSTILFVNSARSSRLVAVVLAEACTMVLQMKEVTFTTWHSSFVSEQLKRRGC